MFQNNRVSTASSSDNTVWRRSVRDDVQDERRKISRDIHDSAIQPYIGLKFALEALSRKVLPDHPLFQDIRRLVEMTEIEIEELRRYVSRLGGNQRFEFESLAPVLRHQAARLGELYGIDVELDVAGEFRVEDGLADEVFHIVGEALSNIRRHTNASCARIRLSCDVQKVKLEIWNAADPGRRVRSFTPQSIAERALARGGVCQVRSGSGRDTVVVVQLPLHQ